MKCLEKDRTRRYETANGLAVDIQRHLDDEPVVARPPTAYRFQKAFRRNKVVFTAAAAVAVALLVGIGVSTLEAVRAVRAEREQNRLRSAAVRALEGEKEQRAQAEVQQKRADAQAQKASESQRRSRRLLYASDMNLAQQALRMNNLGQARRLLDRHRSQPGEEDLRGWEWRYLWQLTRSSALVTLTNRPVRGFSVSFSPDGKRLAAGWRDGCVELWDVAERRLVRTLTERDPAQQGQVAFSPVRNLLAATSEPKVVSLYDLNSGLESPIWRAPDQSGWNVHDLSFSKDGSRLVIYARSTGRSQDAVWVMNVSTSQMEFESRHTNNFSAPFFGAARLSPDNRRLYLTLTDPLSNRCSIQCLDLATQKELWQTERERDFGLTALAISPDGRLLASGSGFEDPTIRIWDTATGRLLDRLDGHTGWVSDLSFTKDGQRLVSSASDQTIRLWDTGSWTQIKVLRGHADEVHAAAISEAAQLIASTGKDGALLLWKEDGRIATEGYQRLPEELPDGQVVALDHSRLLLLPDNTPPKLLDLKRGLVPVSLSGIESSSAVLAVAGTNILCLWNGTNQIVIREFHGTETFQRGAITLDSGERPLAFACHAARQLLAWTEGLSSTSIHLANFATSGQQTELRSDVPGLAVLRFSEDGKYLGVVTANGDSLQIWNLETGQRVLFCSFDGGMIIDAVGAAGGRVLVVAIARSDSHETRFYDLAHPDNPPRSVSGRFLPRHLAVSPDGGLVALATEGGLVQLYDPARGERLEDLYGHLNAVFGVAFSPDGRRLISAGGGREAVKLWDVSTRQELLTLDGSGSLLPTAKWSDDGDEIIAGAPWQVLAGAILGRDCGGRGSARAGSGTMNPGDADSTKRGFL